MEFSYRQKRELSSFAQRSVAMGPRGMVASSQQLATQSGHKILAKGGNAVDAAVAMLCTLSVVEPHSSGIGGDAFALIYLSSENKILGLNGSGRSPYAADLDWFRKKGLTEIPETGILSVTVPGALHAWAEAQKRHGRLDFGDVFEDAINYAQHGFPVSEVIAGEWQNSESKLLAHPAASKTYLIEGKAPRAGQLFQNRDLARTYRNIVAQGTESFYGGEIGEKIVAFSRKSGGLLDIKDFIDHSTTWVEPIMTDYRGYSVVELPPNGQGLTAIEMLNILEGYDIGEFQHNGPHHLHLLVEAKKIAFSDRDAYVADPDFGKLSTETLISKEYAAQCRGNIDPNRAMDPPQPLLYPKNSETVYVTAVDEDRNAVSFISSIYLHFGSGVVVDETGIILQNRGWGFSLDPQHYNCLRPHKRPLHTIIPGMVFKDGHFVMSFGVMGGDMQPQGHAQFLMNLIDFKMNLQEALDAPRVRHIQAKDVYIEDGISADTIAALEEKGHHILSATANINQVGGGQAIYLDHHQNVLLGASDRRKDGCAIGY